MRYSGPQQPKQNEIEQQRYALPPSHGLIVVGQKLNLEERKQRKRRADQADQRDQAQQETHHAVPHLAGSGEVLHENVARQLAPEPGTGVLVIDLRLQLGMEHADLVRKHREMQQHICVHNKEDQRPEDEESEQRQIGAEEGQADRTLQQQVAMGNAADRDQQIEQNEQVAQP